MISFRLPNPLTLLVGCTLVAAASTYVVQAGEYDRRDDPATGHTVVIAGTYHAVPAHPLGPFEAVVAIPRGLIAAASVVFFVFLVGGAFAVVDATGALRGGIDWLVRHLGEASVLAIPIVSLAFAAGGVFEHMQEEIIALVPALLLLTRRLGFDPLTAVGVSIGSASVGAAFSPVDPFQVLIAQKVAQVPQASGWRYRTVVLAVALAIWIAAIVRRAVRTRSQTRSASGEEPPGALPGVPPAAAITARGGVVIGLVLVAFAVFVVGVTTRGWDFDQEAALFFIMGVAAGLIGGLGVAGTVDAFIEGFRSMAFAAMLIGFARAISVVLEEGRIIDTIVHGLSVPLATLPLGLAALGMMVMHVVVHVPVPSVSSQAVLTLPVLVPLSDLLGLSRQITVLAYQYGAGLCEILTPTNGALMAILVATGVRYDQWLRVTGRTILALLALGAAAILAAIPLGVR